MLRKSIYTFLIHRNDDYLVYNTAKNSFWRINEYVYRFIEEIETHKNETSDEEVMRQISVLHTMGILSTEAEDISVADQIRMRHLSNAYSKDRISVTLVPTVSCNLVCPYCFETSKPRGMMSEDTCSKVADFIKSHVNAKYLYLTWFGGEPMRGTKVMEHFLAKIKEFSEDIKLAHHGIITNGTLLDSSRWSVFKEYPLNFLQITLDGKKPTHDKKRIRPDGKGTYDEILHNLQQFASEFPDTSISVRVNIDKNNADEFMDVYDSIGQLFPEKKNLFVYPGIIKGCGTETIDSPFLRNQDIAKIRNKMVERGYPISYPQYNMGGCCATSISSYVIGPKGEIYKCWMDLGKEDRVIGNVSDRKYTNAPLLGRYMLYGSHVMTPECWKCPLLPICSNDCAHERLENMDNKADNDLCCIYKDNNEALLDSMYKFYKSHIR